MMAVSAGAEIELSAAEARGAALAAQGMGRPRSKGRIDARRLRRAIDDVSLLQLDSVNAVCRSHYLPLFSRLGPYPRATLDHLASHADTVADPATRAGRDRALFEYRGRRKAGTIGAFGRRARIFTQCYRAAGRELEVGRKPDR